MSYFSFASNSRAQLIAELISCLLNKNSGDKVLKYQIGLTELPVNRENPKHVLGYGHSGGLSVKGENDKVSCWCFLHIF